MIAILWWFKSFAIVGAGLWLGLLLVQLWLRWGVRQMYAGPTWPHEPAERLLPVLLFRVGMAAGWTIVLMAALMVVGFVCGRVVTASATSLQETVSTLLTTHGGWVALVVFTVNATRQCDHIWEDMNRRQAEVSSRWQHPQWPSERQASSALRPKQ